MTLTLVIGFSDTARRSAEDMVERLRAKCFDLDAEVVYIPVQREENDPLEDADWDDEEAMEEWRDRVDALAHARSAAILTPEDMTCHLTVMTQEAK